MKLARHGLTLGYALAIGACAFVPWSPRVFWTMVMPVVPIGFIVMGFHAWRRACPIAAFGALGSRLHNGRRVPTWLRKVTFVLPLGVLLLCLGTRLVATNGDSLALAIFLGSLAGGAFIFNAIFGGRSFCHYLCPVGVVERVYTDGVARAQKSSACDSCSACIKSCPDIDRAKSYERSIQQRGRRIATYALPGIVTGFYLHFYLRAGDWEAYFDGRWTEAPWKAALVTASGYFFAPQVPDVAAAFITLLTGALLSYAFFWAFERLLARPVPDAKARRHRVLSIASFAALNIFYLFAGAPALRAVPWLARVVAYSVPLVAAYLLYRRWRVSRPRRRGDPSKKQRWRQVAKPRQRRKMRLAVVE